MKTIADVFRKLLRDPKFLRRRPFSWNMYKSEMAWVRAQTRIIVTQLLMGTWVRWKWKQQVVVLAGIHVTPLYTEASKTRVYSNSICPTHHIWRYFFCLTWILSGRKALKAWKLRYKNANSSINQLTWI